MSFATWARQPSTVVGIAIGLGTAAGVGAYYLTGSVDTAVTVAGFAAAAVAALVNDSSAAQTDTARLATDLLAAIRAKNLGNIAALGSDIGAVAQDVEHASSAATLPGTGAFSVPAIPTFKN